MNRKLISNSNYVLRKVLNSKDYLDIIKNFIESFLDMEIEEIELNPYLNLKERYLPKEENFGILDARIKTKKEEINVGIQFVDGMNYIQTKMLLYYAQIHLNQVEYKPQREFSRTVTINFLDYSFFNSPNYYKIITVQSNEENIRLEELEIHAIEFPKFTCKDVVNMNNKEKWIAYLKGVENNKIEEIKNGNKYIKKLDDLLNKYWLEEKME